MGVAPWIKGLFDSSFDAKTCGECSRCCQIGIDVMGFAKNRQPVSNGSTSCIHCGIYITVCPTNVLEFDTHRGEPHQLSGDNHISVRPAT